MIQNRWFLSSSKKQRVSENRDLRASGGDHMIGLALVEHDWFVGRDHVSRRKASTNETKRRTSIGYLMLINASSPPCRSNASKVSLIKSPMFSRFCCPYSMPSPKFATKARGRSRGEKPSDTYNSSFWRGWKSVKFGDSTERALRRPCLPTWLIVGEFSMSYRSLYGFECSMHLEVKRRMSFARSSRLRIPSIYF